MKGIMKISVCTVCFSAGIWNRYLRIKSSKHYLFFCGSSVRFRVMDFPDGALRSHQLNTPNSLGILSTSVQPDAETSTWQHTTLTRDKLPCLRRDSIPQSQQASGRRRTRSPVSA